MELKNTKRLKGFSDDGFLFDINEYEFKKITSRRFPTLLGENKWQSVGNGLLEMCGLLVSEKFDNKYTLRGAIAEKFTQYFLEGKIKDSEMFHFTPESAGYDQFKNNTRFGGVIDIAIKSPTERIVVEVKAKNIKKEKSIGFDMPKEELAQAELLAHLSRSDKFYMSYVFFNDKQEREIEALANEMTNNGLNISKECEKNLDELISKLNLKLGDVVVDIYDFTSSREYTEERMEKAVKVVDLFSKTKTINQILFKPEEVNYLKGLI